MLTAAFCRILIRCISAVIVPVAFIPFVDAVVVCTGQLICLTITTVLFVTPIPTIIVSIASVSRINAMAICASQLVGSTRAAFLVTPIAAIILAVTFVGGRDTPVT